MSKSFIITTLSWVILFDLQSMNWLVGYFASQDRNLEGRAALSAFPTESWPKIQSLTENPNRIPSEPFLSLSTRFCFSNLLISKASIFKKPWITKTTTFFFYNFRIPAFSQVSKVSIKFTLKSKLTAQISFRKNGFSPERWRST